ncbi:dioxygenase [Conexibacter sp. W3-3-2]|nr:dioxygenase [Conexibacter sp. W3-3-2]
MAAMSDEHEHDLGLSHDLPIMVSRRRALGIFGAGIGAVLAGCGSSDEGASTGTTTSSSATSTTATTTGSAASSTSAVPEETGGPFPGDGTNGPNVLTESGVVRQDIRTSIGDASGTAAGAEATVALKLIDVQGGGGPLAGAAIYIWHCTADGKYSLYEDDVAGENFLRGVQESDADGNVTFTTIYPGTYAGRWPHIHFEVYESLEAATTASQKLRTSQIALPQEACEKVYAAGGYGDSAANLAQLSIDTDMVFSDGYGTQLATVTGAPGDGLTMRLNIGV